MTLTRTVSTPQCSLWAFLRNQNGSRRWRSLNGIAQLPSGKDEYSKWRRLGGASLVTMMESTDLRNRNDTPGFGRLDGPRLRRVLLQSQVCPGSMIVVQEISKVPAKASLVEYDDVVQALAANGADHPFYISTLPRRARRGQHCLIPMALT